MRMRPRLGKIPTLWASGDTDVPFRRSSRTLRLLMPSIIREDQARLTPYMAVSTRTTVLAGTPLKSP